MADINPWHAAVKNLFYDAVTNMSHRARTCKEHPSCGSGHYPQSLEYIHRKGTLCVNS